MFFSSPIFLFFFLPLCLILYFNPFIKSTKYKNIILLIFSIIFYFCNSRKYFWLLCVSILFNYFISLIIYKTKYKKTFLFIDIAINIFILLYFKILGVNMVTSNKLLPTIAPLGLAFYTFQEISYIVDVYRKVIEKPESIFKFALYIFLFPQLISGPIVRYDDIKEQLDKRSYKVNNLNQGISQFIIGLFKKCVIADSMASCTEQMFLIGSSSICYSWLTAIFLALYLYYDFSAYSNMAIGLLKIFGFDKIKKNFDYPYVSKSITEFWRKWNISLGTWFNDYLLYPLCNSKVYFKMMGFLKRIFNQKLAFRICNFIVLLIVWILVGLWHGLGINFCCFGIYYFVFLIIEKNCPFIKKLGILSHLYTLLVVCVGTVIFFSFSDPEFSFFKALFINNNFIDNNFLLFLSGYKYLLLTALIGAFPISKLFHKFKYYQGFKSFVLIIMFIISIYFISASSDTPFIYFNF